MKTMTKEQFLEMYTIVPQEEDSCKGCYFEDKEFQTCKAHVSAIPFINCAYDHTIVKINFSFLTKKLSKMIKTIDQAAQDNQFQGDHGTYEYDAIELHNMLTDRFKAGVEFAQRWIPIDEELPMAWEFGHWDGKRSDYVLAKDVDDVWFKAKTYQGILDGNKFCDFVDECDDILSNITHWRPINFK